MGVVLVRSVRMTAVVLLVVGAAVTACNDQVDAGADPDAVATTAAPTTEARAVLTAVGGSGTSGVVRFGATDSDAVEVRIELTGAPPGQNEVTLLQGGDCTADGTSTGGHSVTTVAAGPDGQVSTVLTSDELSLVPAADGFVRGRPVLVVADEAPVACGMVTAIGRWSES